jgi:hypothetical protein
MANKKKQTKRQTTIHKTLKRKKNKKDPGELRCSGRENSSSPTCGTRCVTFVYINPVISHE